MQKCFYAILTIFNIRRDYIGGQNNKGNLHNEKKIHWY
jgi:hypothetical protein